MDNLVNLASSGAPIDGRIFFLNSLEDDDDEHSSMDAQTSIKDKADFGLRRNSKEKDQSESLHDEVEGSVEHSTTDTTISPVRIR